MGAKYFSVRIPRKLFVTASQEHNRLNLDYVGVLRGSDGKFYGYASDGIVLCVGEVEVFGYDSKAGEDFEPVLIHVDTFKYVGDRDAVTVDVDLVKRVGIGPGRPEGVYPREVETPLGDLSKYQNWYVYVERVVGLSPAIQVSAPTLRQALTHLRDQNVVVMVEKDQGLVGVVSNNPRSITVFIPSPRVDQDLVKWAHNLPAVIHPPRSSTPEQSEPSQVHP